jgi:cytochrome c peroxidase
MIRIITFLYLCFLIQSCTKDVTSEEVQLDSNLKRLISNVSPSGNYDYYVLPNSDTDLESIPQDVRNKLTPEKVALGKMLFFETGLSMSAAYAEGIGTYSCASCHIPEAGFRPGAAQGVADGGEGFGLNGENRIKKRVYQEDEIDSQGARPLSLVNVAFVTNTFWNGQFGSGNVNVGTEDVWDLREETKLNSLGYEAIETQNIDGIAVHRISTTKELLDQYGYTPLYDQAFSDIKIDERYTTFVTSLALSAYIRSITADQAPFQSWLKGDHSALTLQEKLGAEVFFGKARCTNCHYEKNLGSIEFHRLGVKDLYQRPSFNTGVSDRRNLGRGGFTLIEEDNYKFKVPQLYNLADDPFYFHGSSKHSLEEVVAYKENAVSENINVPSETLSEKFKPITLTEEERAGLLAFLKNGLRDPNLIRYKPDHVLSGNCFPNNDRLSQIDLGCN